MPSAVSSSALPMPDSWSSCGELMDPPARIDGPAVRAVDDALAGRVLDAGRALALEQDPGDEGAGPDLQVRAVHHRVQVGPRGAQAPAVLDVAVEGGEALLAVPVDVVGQLVAGLLDGLEEGAEQRAGRGPALQDERPGVTAERVVEVRRQAALHAPEVRQAVGVIPGLHARVARPALVVQGVAALEDHPVDAGGAAQDLAAGVVDPAPVHERLRLRLVLPVVVLAADRERERRRHLDEGVEPVVGAARLQDEDAVVLGRAQPVGERAAGRPAADDDEVVLVPGHGSILAAGDHGLPGASGRT